MLRRIRLLVFDLDYLVFDCAALRERSLRKSLIPFAEQIPQDLRLPDAKDIEEGYQALGSRWVHYLDLGLGQEQLLVLEEAFRVHEANSVEGGGGHVFPGIREFIAVARKERLTIALGAESSREYLMSVCDRHNLDELFDMAFCAEEYGSGSTDEMLEEIMNHAEVHPSETLLLGTRPFCFETGRNLDVQSVGCGWGILRHEGLESADYQAFAIDQLYPLIKQADALSASDPC